MGDREHPLLMKGPLVLATLEGRKTQTRRLVTAANSKAYDDAGPASREDWAAMDWTRATADCAAFIVPGAGRVWRVHPRVQPGHVLWVRETFLQPKSTWFDESGSDQSEWIKGKDGIRYVADGSAPEWVRPGEYGSPWRAKRTAIHMPRWACRLVLPVNSVRAERVQEITEGDAAAEGVEPKGWTMPHVMAFRGLWDEINGHRPGASWAENPPLWVYQWDPVR